MADESACAQLVCCPAGNSVPAVITSQPLLTELDQNILTEADVVIST